MKTKYFDECFTIYICEYLADRFSFSTSLIQIKLFQLAADLLLYQKRIKIYIILNIENKSAMKA